MIHPILAVIALGGLAYSFSSICPKGCRWFEGLCYGAMLWLAWWCPWPAWEIFLACQGASILVRAPFRVYQDAKMKRA
jgi:hypothetical protein